MSNGVPPSAAAPSGSGAKAKRASGSTNRRISQAQAVRSMCGCGLVTQSMERSLPARLNPDLARLEVRDRIGHGGGRHRPPGGPEIVAPGFQSERALEAPELAECVAQGVGIPGAGLASAAAPAQRGVTDAAGG